MDKIGPICRSVEDCAVVFDTIYGPDGKDMTVTDYPFNWTPDLNVKTLRVGYLKNPFKEEDETQPLYERSLDVLRSLGIDLIPITLPAYPIEAISFLLAAEAAAAFDDLTCSDKDDMLARQVEDAWPNVFRHSRLIPAVEYIQANRVRTLMMRAVADLMNTIDVYVTPPFAGDNLVLTNLTGHPSVVVPNGVTASAKPSSVTFTGKLYGEAAALAVAKAYQDATDFHLKYPALPK
jgi:Asp-tRNA(Asn)/Glu-tRNA(Gln) amidotransferase A subunit family amidase